MDQFGPLEWYLLGVTTPLGIVVGVAFVNALDRIFEREPRP